MAGDWIKWCCGLASKREVRIVASRLQRDRHEIAGRLMVLWEWLGETIHETDFDPATGDVTVEMGDRWKSEIDDIAGLPNLAEALASPAVRWIQARSGGRITFLRLGRHNGKTAKTRAMEQQKKARQRAAACPDGVPIRSGLETEKSTSTPLPPAGARVSGPKKSPPPDDVPDELLTLEVAIEQAKTAGVPADFAEYVWHAWSGRDGKDGSGVKVRFVAYAKKRWNTEGREWEAGTHNGKKKPHDRNDRNSSPRSIGQTNDPKGQLKGRYAGL
jgi:hypothetical protein